MKPAEFQQLVWKFYKESGRHELPWRTTSHDEDSLDPYAIYISEIMLQQTQAPRVVPKYKEWLEKFPDFPSLAAAATSEVLAAWQGLGYNRRALYTKETAQLVIDEHGGTLPAAETELLSLPGVGPYTAGALQAFIFELPVVFVETNIRTVFIYHFFANQKDVGDEEIRKLVAETLPKENIRAWYWALMDYGSHLKKTVGNANQQSASYQKQSKFTGSNRQLRAEMTRFILKNQPTTLEDLQSEFEKLVAENERMKDIQTNLATLEKEGFLIRNGKTVKLAD